MIWKFFRRGVLEGYYPGSFLLFIGGTFAMLDSDGFIEQFFAVHPFLWLAPEALERTVKIVLSPPFAPVFFLGAAILTSIATWKLAKHRFSGDSEPCEEPAEQSPITPKATTW